MNLVFQVLLYAFCLFLVMIVYTGQKHTDAAGTLRASAFMTAKLLLWSAAGFAAMLGLEALFIR